MRRPPTIEPWQSERQLRSWVRDAPDKETYRRRVAIWMIVHDELHAPAVADLLQVAVPTVWLWIQQYNVGGPDSLTGGGRGGRRHGLLSLDQEAAILRRYVARARRGHVLTVHHLRSAFAKMVGRRVSLDYVYDVLARHDWRKLVPRPRHPNADVEAQSAYKKTSRSASVAPLMGRPAIVESDSFSKTRPDSVALVTFGVAGLRCRGGLSSDANRSDNLPTPSLP
jgi:transposase